MSEINHEGCARLLEVGHCMRKQPVVPGKGMAAEAPRDGPSASLRTQWRSDNTDPWGNLSLTYELMLFISFLLKLSP